MTMLQAPERKAGKLGMYHVTFVMQDAMKVSDRWREMHGSRFGFNTRHVVGHNTCTGQCDNTLVLLQCTHIPAACRCLPRILHAVHAQAEEPVLYLLCVAPGCAIQGGLISLMALSSSCLLTA
jgi:hypothetical protein